MDIIVFSEDIDLRLNLALGTKSTEKIIKVVSLK